MRCIYIKSKKLPRGLINVWYIVNLFVLFILQSFCKELLYRIVIRIICTKLGLTVKKIPHSP